MRPHRIAATAAFLLLVTAVIPAAAALSQATVTAGPAAFTLTAGDSPSWSLSNTNPPAVTYSSDGLDKLKPKGTLGATFKDTKQILRDQGGTVESIPGKLTGSIKKDCSAATVRFKDKDTGRKITLQAQAGPNLACTPTS